MPVQSTGLDLATQNSPNNSYIVAPAGSTYANTFNGVTTTILLDHAINPDIIEEWNKEYTSMLFLMGLPKQGRNRKEWNWVAEAYINAPLEVRAGAALVAPSPGGAEQAIPITDLSRRYINKNDKVYYDENVNAIVVSITGSAGSYVANVRAGQGKGLPAVTQGQLLGNAGNHRADGKSSIDTVLNPELITYSNIMEDMGDFAVRWDPDEMLELKNSQRVDLIAKKMKTAKDKFNTSFLQRFFVSQYERFTLADGQNSTATRGFLAQQADAGVGTINVTTSNFTDILRQSVFDIQLSGADDLILAGTGRSLQHAGLGEKSERLRYTVGDKTYNMNMTRYEFEGHAVTPLRMDQWEDRGLYGNTLANDLVLFRRSDLSLTYLNGKPMMSKKFTLQNRHNAEPASLYDLHLMWWNATFGMELHRPAFTRRFKMNY